ncbi:hypothetical protein [Glycomyces buryatensis]|uniref:hypothetical protein n=1 Tax=Glycomyces buryatensis TaxID=2570927 RepID=UPI001B3C1578|nr:hypothetical protein [Glycomyces buryatensis]
MARTAVISGGGTGYAVAERFASAGDKVVIVGRREAVLETAAALAHWLAAPEVGHITAQIIQTNGGALAGH